MAEALVKFFLQRLNSLLRHQTEIFSGLERQMELLLAMLGDIGKFCEDPFCKRGDEAVCSWINELRDLIHGTDDLIDEFILQMDKQKLSDRSVLSKSFTSDLQEIDSQLARIANRMTELKMSNTVEGDKEDNKDNPEREDDQTSAHGKPATIREEEEDNKENSHEMEESQTAGAKNSITSGGEENDKEKSHEMDEIQTEKAKNLITSRGEENDKENSRETEDGQTSSQVAFPFAQKYTDLPYYLQYCLIYCCVFPENSWISKGRFIRLLVAEGLVQEEAGKLMEVTAEENISKLINQEMLQAKEKHRGEGIILTLNPHYREFICGKTQEENFSSACTSSHFNIPNAARRISIYSDMKTVAPHFNNVRPRSLFFLGSQDLSGDSGNWLNFNGAKFLRILHLDRTKIKRLPDEVGDLIHLTYLGLKHSDINELPATLGNLHALQTLDIKWCGDLPSLPLEVLSLVRLRHMKIYKRLNVGGVKVPPGIERLRNILSLTGIHAGGGIARELSNLICLRRLGVMDVVEEDIADLFASIMMIQSLLSLSLEAKHIYNPGTRFHFGRLVLPESFSAPPLLEKLRLEGRLEKVPIWFGSMGRLTKLRLGFSQLSENPASVLQVLPNLKILILWQAYDAKQIGKEFCRVGGFPRLEVLTIASHVLEEWTEIEDGALPSLQCLVLQNCLNLKMLPEGLQFVSTLKKLDILPLLDEHMERLKPDGGEENYKISNIPRISFIPMSDLVSSCPLPPCTSPEVEKCKDEA